MVLLFHKELFVCADAHTRTYTPAYTQMHTGTCTVCVLTTDAHCCVPPHPPHLFNLDPLFRPQLQQTPGASALPRNMFPTAHTTYAHNAVTAPGAIIKTDTAFSDAFKELENFSNSLSSFDSMNNVAVAASVESVHGSV